jgi:hypothetical protein
MCKGVAVGESKKSETAFNSWRSSVSKTLGIELTIMVSRDKGMNTTCN